MGLWYRTGFLRAGTQASRPSLLACQWQIKGAKEVPPRQPSQRPGIRFFGRFFLGCAGSLSDALFSIYFHRFLGTVFAFFYMETSSAKPRALGWTRNAQQEDRSAWGSQALRALFNDFR